MKVAQKAIGNIAGKTKFVLAVAGEAGEKSRLENLKTIVRAAHMKPSPCLTLPRPE